MILSNTNRLGISMVWMLSFACAEPNPYTGQPPPAAQERQINQGFTELLDHESDQRRLIFTQSQVDRLEFDGDRLRVKLFGNQHHELLLKRVRQISADGYSWFGQLDGNPKSYFSVTYRNGIALGSALIEGHQYSIHTDSDGRFHLIETDEDSVIHCATEVHGRGGSEEGLE